MARCNGCLAVFLTVRPFAHPPDSSILRDIHVRSWVIHYVLPVAWVCELLLHSHYSTTLATWPSGRVGELSHLNVPSQSLQYLDTKYRRKLYPFHGRGFPELSEWVSEWAWVGLGEDNGNLIPSECGVCGGDVKLTQVTHTVGETTTNTRRSYSCGGGVGVQAKDAEADS